MGRHYLNSYAWYEDDNTLHLDISAMLHALHVADTPQNREDLTRLAERECAKYWAQVPRTVVEDT